MNSKNLLATNERPMSEVILQRLFNNEVKRINYEKVKCKGMPPFEYNLDEQ